MMEIMALLLFTGFVVLNALLLIRIQRNSRKIEELRKRFDK